MRLPPPVPASPRSRALFAAAASMLAYVFMEWLFFATMPSFMSTMGWPQKVAVFLVAGFVLGLPVVMAAAALALVSPRLAASLPALVLACLALILLDNFTYTLFRVGVVTSAGVVRLAYAAGFLLALAYLWKRVAAWISANSVPVSSAVWYSVLGVSAVSAVAFLVSIPQFRLLKTDTTTTNDAHLPNIILIGIDGVDATHMSLYGYDRETTPNIARLSRTALVAENAFSNAAKTGGSLTSILTGKPATETRVLFPPDILMGPDAYQHLPGILKQHGYHTVQITMQYYGDAYERNVLDGFDIVNGRAQAQVPLLSRFAGMGGGGSGYFIGQVVFRVEQRLAHIFFIQQMQNPYVAVTKPTYALHDDQRMRELFEFLDNSTTPLFAHVHLMDTHGPEFYVPRQHFSKPDEPNKDWNLDYYDDAIRDADGYIGALFAHLEATGKADDTLVILYSDHGLNWSTLDRVPLLYWFPREAYAGSIRENVQLLDIAPTVLDYLRIPRPSWMSGMSLLEAHLPPARPIFSAVVNTDLLRVTEDRTTWVVNQAKIGPPFFELGAINLVVCDQWYSLSVEKPHLTHGTVAGSTSACEPATSISPEKAAELIVGYLKHERYDVSSLPAEIPLEAARP